MSRVFVMLTDDEAVKLHALGGGPWFRLQLQHAAVPTAGLRSAYGLTAPEKRQILADLPHLGRVATAAKFRVKPTTVDKLRRNAHLPIDLRRRAERAALDAPRSEPAA